MAHWQGIINRLARTLRTVFAVPGQAQYDPDGTPVEFDAILDLDHREYAAGTGLVMDDRAPMLSVALEDLTALAIAPRTGDLVAAGGERWQIASIEPDGSMQQWRLTLAEDPTP